MGGKFKNPSYRRPLGLSCECLCKIWMMCCKKTVGGVRFFGVSVFLFLKSTIADLRRMAASLMVKTQNWANGTIISFEHFNTSLIKFGEFF